MPPPQSTKVNQARVGSIKTAVTGTTKKPKKIVSVSVSAPCFERIEMKCEKEEEQKVILSSSEEAKKVEESSIYCIPKEMFNVLEQEMRCGICLSVYKEPIELPCFHVFCLDCLRS